MRVNMPSVTPLKASHSHIVHGFQAFYYELLKQKEICLSTFFAEETKSVDPNVEISETDQNDKVNKLDAIIVNVQQKLVITINDVCETINKKSKINKGREI